MKKKFIASYSGGKESILALHRMVKQGYEPIALITTYDSSKEKNWFHGLSKEVIEKVSDSLNIPIWLAETNGADYGKKFEETLIRGKKMGAEFCIFGDIFIEEHYSWCKDRCIKAGIVSKFPLFGEDSEKLVKEFLELGFTANITVVDLKKLNESYLGRLLSSDLLNEFSKFDIDICGEYGEYHTFVSDGPLFKYPVKFNYGKIDTSEEGYAQLPIMG